MNPGILANIIYIVFIILIFSGWFEKLVSSIGTKKGVILFLILLLFSTYIKLPFLFGWQINVGGYILPFIMIMIFFIASIKKGRIYILTASLLLGAVLFLIKEFIRLDPVILVFDEIYELPPILMIITVLVVPNIIQRINILALGMLIGEILFYYHHIGYFTYVVLGNGHFRDLLWLTLVQVIIFHYGLEMIVHFLKDKKLLKMLKDKVRMNE